MRREQIWAALLSSVQSLHHLLILFDFVLFHHLLFLFNALDRIVNDDAFESTIIGQDVTAAAISLPRPTTIRLRRDTLLTFLLHLILHDVIHLVDIHCLYLDWLIYA